MNLFKKDPEKIFQVVAALITVVLAIVLFVFFSTRKNEFVPMPKKQIEEVVSQKPSQPDLDSFGAVHVSVESPSFARSNFDVNPATDINVYFNKEVDKDSLAGKVSLIELSTLETVELELVDSVVKQPEEDTGNYTWKWEKTWKEYHTYRPASELKNLGRYKLSIRSGYQDTDSTETCTRNFIYEFMVASNPGIANTNISQEDTIPLSDGLRISFSSPMSIETLKESVIVTPSVEGLSYELFDKIFVIKGFVKGQSYSVAVPQSLTDLYERNMPEDTSFDFVVL